MSAKLSVIQYRPDSASLFRNLLDLPYCVFLDSGHGSSFAGRYDILAADPYLTLTTIGTTTKISSRETTQSSVEDPLDLLRRSLGKVRPSLPDIPFAGGAIGCLSYDIGRRFEHWPAVAARDIEFPDMVVGLYDWAFVVDHEERRTFLVSAGRDRRTHERWAWLTGLAEELCVRPRPAFEVVSDVRSDFDRAGYALAFGDVQEHIRRGDCYQVNLAQRFDARVRGDAWDAYTALRRISPAPFSVYMSTPHGDILSSSPERFLQVADGRVETKPIKGTRPRSVDAAVDRRLRQELANSPKDRAENVMIVDLLRNDLGKVCAPGSVTVTRLFDIESFAHVHHLVSTVSGQLAPGRHALDLVRGCFPGGSITGAPKLRAMEIIEALEPVRRSVYCGSLGYLGFDGRMDLNIAIRTLLRCGNSIYAWAGGGIVADSNVDAEYQESLDKASGLLAVLSGSSVSAAG
ncbi:MAG: aminodeoxychorismate synthase component I [Gammaproteobacteria bacterium]